jgi:ankyrin repeat protein
LNSPLHYALAYKNFDIADLLKSKKADEELKNHKGYTPWQCIALTSNI